MSNNIVAVEILKNDGLRIPVTALQGFDEDDLPEDCFLDDIDLDDIESDADGNYSVTDLGWHGECSDIDDLLGLLRESKGSTDFIVVYEGWEGRPDGYRVVDGVVTKHVVLSELGDVVK